MENTHRLPSFVKPERYRIILKPDLNKFTFDGEEVISLTLEKSTGKITLHSAEIKIKSVEFDGLAGKISYNKKMETSTFSFSKV